MILRIRTSRAARVLATLLIPSMLLPASAIAAPVPSGGDTDPNFGTISTTELVNVANGDFNYSIPLLDVGGNAIIGHNMTIGSDPTELLDVFNRTEFNADVFINAPSNLDVGGNIIVQGETQLGNTDVQGLVVNATSQILADLTVGRNCFDVFTIDSTATFNCDTTFNGGVDLNGNIDIPGDVQLGSDCSDKSQPVELSSAIAILLLGQMRRLLQAAHKYSQLMLTLVMSPLRVLSLSDLI